MTQEHNIESISMHDEEQAFRICEKIVYWNYHQNNQFDIKTVLDGIQTLFGNKLRLLVSENIDHIIIDAKKL